jgi:hypothetical protein
MGKKRRATRIIADKQSRQQFTVTVAAVQIDPPAKAARCCCCRVQRI